MATLQEQPFLFFFPSLSLSNSHRIRQLDPTLEVMPTANFFYTIVEVESEEQKISWIECQRSVVVLS